MAILSDWVKGTFYITDSNGRVVEHALGTCVFSRLESNNRMWICVIDIEDYHSDLPSLFVVVEAENGETMTIPALDFVRKGSLMRQEF